MDFPSSGVSRNHQTSFRTSAVHHPMFGTPSSIFRQPNPFGRGGVVSRNEFNFPLRSHGGTSSNPHNSGQYSGYSRVNEPVMRQSMYGPNNPLQSEQVMNNFIPKPSATGIQNNHRVYRHAAGYGSQGGKTNNGKEKPTKSLTQLSSTKDRQEPTQQLQQYRIFKRGDSIPGVQNTTIVKASCNSDTMVCDTNSKSEISDYQSSSTQSSTLDSVSGNTEENTTSNGTSAAMDLPSGSDISAKNLPASGNENSNNGVCGNRNTVTLVSEIAKFHGLHVEYRLVKETGPPHAPTFTVNLTLGTEEYQGCGSSIKRAQHAAAMDALEKTSFITPPPRTQPKRNYVGNGQKRPNWALIQLTSLAEEMKQPLSFALQPMTLIDPFFRREPPSLVTVHFGDRVFTGEGPSFNSAKNAATIIALKTLIKEKHEMELAKMLAEGVNLFNIEEQNLNSENKSPISVVHEMALKRGLTVSFDVTNESGPPHMKVFTVKCNVGEHETEGQGSTKQQAKKISSEMMMSKLREVNISLPNSNTLGNTLKSIQRGFTKTRVTKKKSTPIVKDVDKQSVSPISKLIQIAHSKKLKEPEFRLVSQSAEINEPSTQGNKSDRRNKRKSATFTIEVSVGPHLCQGTGINKKTAKKAAAEAALIALGCAPASEIESSKVKGTLTNSICKESSDNSDPRNDGEINPSSQSSSPSKNKKSTTSSRQIVPGVLVRKTEDSLPGAPMQSTVAQELIRVNNTISSAQPSTHAETDKLNYLAITLNLNISFSDFPKKDEFLSVVSFGANPPHVAHGIGKTIEEARNLAAQKILEELTDLGLDNVTNKQCSDDSANGL